MAELKKASNQEALEKLSSGSTGLLDGWKQIICALIGMQNCRRKENVKEMESLHQKILRRRSEHQRQEYLNNLVNSSNCLGTTADLYLQQPRVFTGDIKKDYCHNQ